MRSVALMLVMVLVGQTSLKAQVCTQAVGIEAGVVTPCDGVLWSPTHSVQAVECVSVDLPKCVADVDYHSGRSATCRQHISKLETLCDGKIGQLIDIAEDAAGLKPEPWYKNPWLMLGLGVVIGGASVYYIGTNYGN